MQYPWSEKRLFRTMRPEWEVRPQINKIFNIYNVIEAEARGILAAGQKRRAERAIAREQA
jgi:hypothetical protein